MLQAYSLNLTFTDGAAIPLNNIVLKKGCTAELAAPASIDLNKAGIYMVSMDVELTGTAAGTGTIQLTRDGVAQPFASTSVSLAAGDTVSGSFISLVQVPQNNTCCCLTSPVTLQCIYSGAAATGDINICITKIC